jgi:uncharacterized protein YbbK (DUF523 family)
MKKPSVGISSCLLGEKVRYDGGHKLQRFLIDTLGSHVRWVPVCPESECGLGVPREPMQLTGNPESPELVTIETGLDHTGRLLGWADKRFRELEPEGICGFVLKCRSPSCALNDAPVLAPDGSIAGEGPGLFTLALMDKFPLLALVDEEALVDPHLREAFLESLNK